MGRNRIVIAVGLLLAALLLWFGPRYLRAASVLLSSVQLEDPSGITRLVEQPVGETLMEVEADGSPLPARLYRPLAASPDGAVLLVHGIHPSGMEEPRFRGFARALARVGKLVMTPALPELASLNATPATVHRIGLSAQALQALSGLPVTAIGISVGGGLCLIAAAQQSKETPIGGVVAIGSHADLSRVARHYAGQTARDISGAPAREAPHPYGIRVLALAHAARVFGEADAYEAQSILRLYLTGQVRASRARLPKLTQPGQDLMTALFDAPDGQTVQTRLRGVIDQVEPALRSVSPEGQLQSLTVPVMLLHGATDPVIPASELSHLARAVPAPMLRATLVTPVLTHTDFPSGVSPLEYVKVMHFVAGMLQQPSSR